MKIETAHVLLASAGGWLGSALEDLSGKKGGIMLLCSVALLSIAGTATAMATFGDWRSIPRRVSELEGWRKMHTDSVSGPGLARIGRLEDQTNTLRGDISLIREMTFQLYCDRFPTRCDGVPR